MSSAWSPTPIPGLMRTSRIPSTDVRGSFTKVLGEDDEGDGGAVFRTREVFWSRSHRGVFRGLHVQLPPRATRKLVFVTHGVVRDVVLDLRVGSPTERRIWTTDLDPSSGGLVVPEGCAHGFEVLSDEACMVYLQEDFHSPEHDGGVLFSSTGLVLDVAEPIVSDRDLALPPIDGFVSPFTFA